MVFRTLEEDHGQLSELLDDLNSGWLRHDLPRTFELLDLLWARLAVHIRAENVCLFPAILNAPRELFRARDGLPSVEEAQATIESLQSDHNFFMDELARAVKVFRELLANPQNEQQVVQNLGTIRAHVDAVSFRLEPHNVLEEEQVYNWPALMLSATDLEALRAALRRQLDNLPHRFTAQ